jgi:hypothetical protein
MGQSLANYHKANTAMGNNKHKKHSTSSKKRPEPRAAAKAGAVSAPTIKAPEPVPEITSVKGLTREGKPRQRAYRTYFGVTDKGSVIKYKSYEAREIDVKEGRIKRITAHEAREIEADGARPSPLVITTQWSPKAGGTQPQPVATVAEPAALYEVRATLNVITRLVTELQSKMAAIEGESRALSNGKIIATGY